MGIRLSERDFKIMLGLARNGFMRIDQIQNKWIKSYKSCAARLKKLRKYEYIDVTYIERNGSGIYYLLKDGLNLINGYYGTEYKQYSKSNKILHNISCSEFYINVPKEYEVLDYEIEYYLDEFIPDIYMVYKNEDREVDCLVEIDNLGRVNRFMPKVTKYNEFYNSSKYKEYFKSFPRCIIVSNSKSLEEKIKENSKIPFKIISFDELKKGGLSQCLD